MSDDTTNDECNHQNHDGFDDEMTDEQHLDALWCIYENLNKRLKFANSSAIKAQDNASVDRYFDKLRVLVNRIPHHI